MEKRELYDKFEELSQNLMSMLAEVEAIKANFSGILDENTALKLENDKLREHLSQVVQEETQLRRTSQGFWMKIRPSSWKTTSYVST